MTTHAKATYVTCEKCGGRGWVTEPGPEPDLPNKIVCDECGGRGTHRLAEWQSHEGMVTVYDADGRYQGCMGIESWRILLAEGDANAR